MAEHTDHEDNNDCPACIEETDAFTDGYAEGVAAEKERWEDAVRLVLTEHISDRAREMLRALLGASPLCRDEQCVNGRPAFPATNSGCLCAAASWRVEEQDDG